MQFAVKKNNFVTNIIIADWTQIEELERGLNAELIDLAECNVSIGDMWDGEHWTRNVNGEQVVVDTTPVHNPTTDERIANLEGSTAVLEESTASIEDALCEMDSATEARLAAIEDALCELDMGGTIE